MTPKIAKNKFMKVCFPSIADKNAKVLILGTMPGEESLRKKQYYAHPRNAFWYIMERLFNIDSKVSYEERKSILKVNHIALWDVLMFINYALELVVRTDTVVHILKPLMAKISKMTYSIEMNLTSLTKYNHIPIISTIIQ